MKLKLRNLKGDVLGDCEVRDDVFGAVMNKAVVHQVMVGQLANARQGTAKVKTRSQVSGGGAKPRPQKHTGRSRQGSTNSPTWKGGGVVFGPVPRGYRQRTPKKMKRRSLVTVLSDKVRQDRLVLLDKVELDQPRTKDMIKILSVLEIRSSVLLVTEFSHLALRQATGNIPKVKLLPVDLLNTLDILNCNHILMTVGAVRRAEVLWGRQRVPTGASYISEGKDIV